MKNKQNEASVEEPVAGDMDALSLEIDGAVEDAMNEIVSAEPSEPDAGDETNLPPDEGQSGEDAEGGPAPEAKGEQGESGGSEVTDEQVERAVRAGMTVADAKSFTDAQVLGRFVSMLEQKAGGVAEAGEASASTGEETDDGLDAMLKKIPDLDPDEYEEEIVSVVKGLKEMLKQQQGVINSLTKQGVAAEGSWLDSQVALLGEDYVKALGQGPQAKLDPTSGQHAKRVKMQEKFTVLEAGYKAAGKNMDRSDIFREVVTLTLGDVQNEAAISAKRQTLAKRSAQHISRTGVNRAAVVTDPFDDAAEELDQKYFGKR